MTSLGQTVLDGNVYSTWSLGSAVDIPTAVNRLKTFADDVKIMHVGSVESSGNKATVPITFDNPALVSDRAFTLQPDSRGFTMLLNIDSTLKAASVTVYLNKGQNNVDQNRMRRLACTLIAFTLGGKPPASSDKPTRSRWWNLFKNQQKAAAAKRAQTIQLMTHARTLLYQRAQASGKAIAFLPMNNAEEKYEQTSVNDRIAGGKDYQSYRFDQTATMLWRGNDASESLLKVGNAASLYQGGGLFGYVQSIDHGHTMYGIYIIDPGRYALIGWSYELRNSNLPKLSQKRWRTKPKLGTAVMAITNDLTFDHRQQWFNAQYQDVRVDDGSACNQMAVVGGSGGIAATPICVDREEQYHTETRMTDPGGMRDVTTEAYAGGLSVSVKLAQPLAYFDAKPGEVLVTDGFVVRPDSMAYDHDACKQIKNRVVACDVRSLKLFRINGSVGDLALQPALAAKVPDVAGFVSRVQYQPMQVAAHEGDEVPGTYEAGWTTPYNLSTH